MSLKQKQILRQRDPQCFLVTRLAEWDKSRFTVVHMANYI